MCFTLVAGQSLTQAVQSAFAKLGFGFGYLRLDGASFAPLRFVTPAPSPGHDHAAWYSAMHESTAPTHARHAGVHLGQREGLAFLHCHGLWDGSTALPDAGHMLCDDSVQPNPLISCTQTICPYLTHGCDISVETMEMDNDPRTIPRP